MTHPTPPEGAAPGDVQPGPAAPSDASPAPSDARPMPAAPRSASSAAGDEPPTTALPGTATDATPQDDPPPDARTPATPPTDAQIEAELLRLCAARGPQRSFCPSEAARALRPDAAGQGPRWQSLMGPVRRVAFALARSGALQVLRKGRVVDPAAAAGVIRLRATGPAEDPA